MKKNLAIKSLAVASAFILSGLNSGSAFAAVGGSDFNTVGDLDANYEVYSSGSSTSFAEGDACGLSSSRCIVTDPDNATIARQKTGLAFPTTGNSISTSVYFKNTDDTGYATLGFTGLTALSDSNVGGTPLNPNDAISFNAHGGGYIIMNAQVGEVDQTWDVTSNLTNTHAYADIVNQGENKWFKETITVTRASGNTVNVTYKVEEVNDDATTFGDGSYWAEYTVEGLDATALIAAGTVYPFFGNTMGRVSNFDDAGDQVANDSGSSSGLPNTGENVFLTSTVGVSLLVVGFATVFASRRKQLS